MCHEIKQRATMLKASDRPTDCKDASSETLPNKGVSASPSLPLAINYHDYLLTKEWQVHRQAALRRAKHRCQICGERDGLEVHHLNYDRLGHELPADLQVVCHGCHWIAENVRRDPGYKLPEPLPDGWKDIEPLPPDFDKTRLPIFRRKPEC